MARGPRCVQLAVVPDDLHTLVHSARRRMCLAAVARMLSWRVASVLAVALSLAAVSRWTSVTPWPLIYVIATVCLISLILQLRQLPGRLAAAMELDRQYASAELLSSAITITPDSRNDVEVAVLCDARERTHEIELSRFDSGRTGLRWWVFSLVVTGLIPALYVAPEMHEGRQVVSLSRAEPGPTAALHAAPPLQLSSMSTAANSPAGLRPGTSASSTASDTTSATGSTSSRDGQSADGISSGAGLATGAFAPAPETPQTQQSAAASDRPASAGATVGRSTQQLSADDDATGAVTSSRVAASAEQGNTRPPPAQDEIDAPPLPPRYRAVVRSYFSR